MKKKGQVLFYKEKSIFTPPHRLDHFCLLNRKMNVIFLGTDYCVIDIDAIYIFNYVVSLCMLYIHFVLAGLLFCSLLANNMLICFFVHLQSYCFEGYLFHCKLRIVRLRMNLVAIDCHYWRSIHSCSY